MKRCLCISTKLTSAISGLLAAWVLIFALIAADGRAHELLHRCGDSSPEQCAACLLLHGQILVSPTTVAGYRASSELDPPRYCFCSENDPSFALLPPGRAPPVSADSL